MSSLVIVNEYLNKYIFYDFKIILKIYYTIILNMKKKFQHESDAPINLVLE